MGCEGGMSELPGLSVLLALGLKNGLRALDRNGSWCIAARLTHLLLLRVSMSSPSSYRG